MSNFNYLRKSFFTNDWKSGVAVFLVALPLCLGIALASGAPLFSGVIAGIIGGIVVGMISGSNISVSGPAAGLTIIVATAIKDLGSFQGFLVAVILAGILQVIFGYFKGGRLSAFFPNSVIKGMLVAIGIVIILKQIPHALGDDQDYIGEFEFEQVADNQNTITELIRSVVDFNYGAVIITVTCLLVMIFWNKLAEKFKAFQSIPSSLLAVGIGIFFNEMYRIYKPDFYLGNSNIHMVSVPVFNSFQDLKNVLISPDFSFLNHSKVYVTAIILAVVASLESLLSLEAADSLDTQGRISSGDRELVAQGFGNIISGLLGGIPLTSVVVRSSANAYAQAKTRMSTIFHGVLLLVSVLFIPLLLNKIPLASLSAVLLMVGYKLASPKVFKAVFKEGFSQFIPFLVTILVVVRIDLLWGIGVGTLVGILFVLRTNFNNAISINKAGEITTIKFNKDVYFMNKSQVKAALAGVHHGEKVIVDGSNALFMDHDIFEILVDFKKKAAKQKISVEFKNIKKDTKININDLSIN